MIAGQQASAPDSQRWEIHPLVLHAAPHALDEDVVSPGPSPIHAQRAAGGQYNYGELLGRELTALVGVDDLGHAVTGQGQLDHLISLPMGGTGKVQKGNLRNRYGGVFS